MDIIFEDKWKLFWEINNDIPKEYINRNKYICDHSDSFKEVWNKTIDACIQRNK